MLELTPRTTLLALLVILIIGGAGIIAFHAVKKAPKPTIQVLGTAQDSQNKSASPSGSILIDVAGAIRNPGVVEIEVGGRVEDAIKAAGGFSDEADFPRIAKEVNRAAILRDGTKLYIPKVGDTGLRLGTLEQIPEGTGSRVVNINAASESHLETLSGIGPVTARKIIDGRPYQSIEELVNRKIVSKSVFGKIKESISVY